MKNLSQYLNYLIVAILLIYGGFYFYQTRYSTNQHDISSLKPPAQTIDVDGIVNKFMQQTAAQGIHDQYASQMALKKQLAIPIKITEGKNEIRPEDVPVEKQIHQIDHIDSPAEAIRQEVFDKEMQAKSDQQDRLEYARQYIENARRAGYRLVLSEDLKVMSVTPIRKPSQDDDSVDSYPAD